MIRRRLRILALSALALSSAGIAIIPSQPALAVAPMTKTVAPAYYRLMLGAFEVTALSDGTVALPVDQMLTNTTKAKVDSALRAAFETSPLETSVNAYLIHTGTKLVLIDTGAGTMFGPTLGKLIRNLEASGYRPEQIDDVLITHLHPDHIGGLLDGTKAAFPDATLHVSKADADYWLSKANSAAAPDSAKAFFAAATGALAPYIEAKHFQTFEGETEIVPGIRAIPMPGHSAGHTGYLVESQGQKLLAWGDIVHAEAVQFASPSVTFVFDADAKGAEAERNEQFRKAASDRTLVASAHIAFPGLGHVQADRNAYRWIPIQYSIPSQ